MVDLVNNGPDGLHYALEHSYALLILDVMLPGQSGFDILRQLRALPEMDGLRVMMLTAKGQVRDRDVAQEFGVDLFMTKPFSNAEIVAAVRALGAA